jgi:hypothetical protein
MADKMQSFLPGVVDEHFHRKHGEAVQWRILAVVPVADWVRAERRAIRLARAIFGRLCVNVLSGGDGFTSSEARELGLKNAADPAWRAKNRAQLERTHQDPAWQAANRAHLGRINSEPEARIQLGRMNEASTTPEARKKRSAKLKSHANTIKGKAQLARAAAIRSRKAARRRAAKALAPFIRPPIISRAGVAVWATDPPARVCRGSDGPDRLFGAAEKPCATGADPKDLGDKSEADPAIPVSRRDGGTRY